MGLRDLARLLRSMGGGDNGKMGPIGAPDYDRPWCTFVSRPWVSHGSSRSRSGCKSRSATLREYEQLPPLWLCDDHAKVVEGRTPHDRLELESMAADDVTSQEFMWTYPQDTTVAVYGPDGKHIGRSDGSDS